MNDCQFSKDVLREKLSSLKSSLKLVIKGKDDILDSLIVTLLANGHVLLEDVPGVGKTSMAKALAKALSCEYHRIQFTPDLMPSDVNGMQIFNPKEASFNFVKGPIFTNILLADEINRASPRTQSALLEAMSENQVTMNGESYSLEYPFLVIATQNPIEHQGTFQLPEAQMDRFMMLLSIGYPEEEAELEMLLEHSKANQFDAVHACLSSDEILFLQNEVRGIDVCDSVSRYIVSLIRETREHGRVEAGASPRATLILYRCCQARAFMQGRDYVLPDDVKALAEKCLAHRLVLTKQSRYGLRAKSEVINEVLSSVKVPR